MKTVNLFNLALLVIVFNAFFLGTLNAQQIPYAYPVENTGADCPKPVFHSFNNLPEISTLPDPFAWANGSGRDTSFSSWKCLRAEVMSQIMHYEIGQKPERPNSIEATYTEGILTIIIKVGGNSLTLSSQVVVPEGEGPFPAIIGIGRGSGSLPNEIFADRNIATVTFNFGQVMSHSQKRGEEPFNKLYPGTENIGSYAAWSWGVSRIIDGLELVPEINIDLTKLAVSGCSFAGKMALFAGAFDERIALTIAQEPGGGGAAAWRVSETLGNVETLARAQGSNWYLSNFNQFNEAVNKLPFDHHQLMAMVAPRALLVLGNLDYEWLADESGYVSCMAAHQVWKTFGVADRFGFAFTKGHRHCALHQDQLASVEAYVDKFLVGKLNTDTNITVHPFENTDYKKWFKW
jgi:hypothetical protein